VFIFRKFLILFVLCSVPSLVFSKLSFNILPVKELIQKEPSVQYQQCFGEVPFSLEPFLLNSSYPNNGKFNECFILTVQHGSAFSECGFTLINNNFIQEMIWAGQDVLLDCVKPVKENQVIKVAGRVAVISQMGFWTYPHWLNEVLGRLALLEMHNVEYDYLYVPQRASFMKETLILWGIDPKKIIIPTSESFCVQADELIVPSLLINTDVGFKHIGLYIHPLTLDYVSNKLLNAAKKIGTDKEFCKKVFISRKDATNARRITNEDEVFALFQAKGFERYDLCKLSVVEQILLFNNAEILVGEHGTGLVNIMFCKPGTKVIELFHVLLDSSFWYLAQIKKLDYVPIKTMDFIEDYMTA